MVKNSTLQKIIDINEEALNEKIVEKSKLELLINNINKSINLINSNIELEKHKIKQDDLNMVRAFSKYREVCIQKINYIKQELEIKEASLDILKLDIKEIYIEKEKFNIVLQKQIIRQQHEISVKELKAVDEINLRNYVNNDN